MKKKMLMPVISSLVALCISVTLTTTIGHAQCGCSCWMVCDNTCQWECEGCGLVQGWRVAQQCCEQAHAASGDTGPCFPENF